jgi:hypothetical protein
MSDILLFYSKEKIKKSNSWDKEHVYIQNPLLRECHRIRDRSDTVVTLKEQNVSGMALL